MRILITRPGEDAAPLAAMLRAKGHVVVVAPLLDIQPLRDATISLDGVQAILLTSANGARALAKADPRRDLPVLAVGEATAAAARAAGFTAVDNAGGDVSDLAALAKTRFDPNKGALLHAAGSVIAGDLGGALAAGGFELRRVVIYRAEPATVLPAAAAAALRDGSLDAALFFSPRTAATFVRLVREAGLEAACRRVVALGLSPAVIEAANGIGWAATMAAASPKEAALVDALDRLAQHGAPSADPASPMTEPQPTQSPKPNTEPTSTRAAAIPAPRWLAVVAVGAAVAALALAGWQANLPKGDEAAALGQRLEPRIGDIERRLGDIERKLGESAAAQGPARAEIERRLAALAERIAASEAGLAARPVADPGQLAMLAAENRRLAAEISRFRDDLAQLGAKAATRPGHGEQLLLAIGQLRDAVARGDPYAAEFKTMQVLAAEDQAAGALLPPLAERAERGVATRDGLRASFAPVAAEVVRAARRAESGEWWRPVLDALGIFVSVRPVGEVQGDAPSALVARAEMRLAAGDLAGALEAVTRLNDASAAAAAGWLAEARARLRVERALAELSALALRTSGQTP